MTAPLVLLADNDAAVSALLTEVLVRVGVSVCHAYDGEAAKGLARNPAIRVLVCDLDMPRIPGIEVLESLRELTAPPMTVVITGYLDADVQDRLRRLPFVRQILRKPFDLLLFAEQVRKLALASRDVPAGSAEVGLVARGSAEL